MSTDTAVSDSAQHDRLRIAVLGGTGMIGSRVVAEADARGHRVTAVSRSGRVATPEVVGVAADLNDVAAVSELASDHDVLVAAVGPSREPGGDPVGFPDVLMAAIDAMGATRVIVIGGAGSLHTSDGTRLVDLPEFPAAYRVEALAHAQALDALRARGGDNWSYLSPAPEIAPGERTGSYRLGTESPAGDFISAEDLAIAVLDEIEQPRHSGGRFTVAH